MKNPKDILLAANATIDERGAAYGAIENNFELIADQATLRLGRDVHPYEVAVIMTCVKLARLFANPTHLDSHIDAINYQAFAAAFAEDYAAQYPGELISYKRKKSKRKAAEAGQQAIEALVDQMAAE